MQPLARLYSKQSLVLHAKSNAHGNDSQLLLILQKLFLCTSPKGYSLCLNVFVGFWNLGSCYSSSLYFHILWPWQVYTTHVRTTNLIIMTADISCWHELAGNVWCHFCFLYIIIYSLFFIFDYIGFYLLVSNKSWCHTHSSVWTPPSQNDYLLPLPLCPCELMIM